MNELIEVLQKRKKNNNNVYDKINDLICIMENKEDWLNKVIIEELKKIDKMNLTCDETQVKKIIINDIIELFNKKNYIERFIYENLTIYEYSNKIDIYSKCFNEKILSQLKEILKDEFGFKELPPIIIVWDDKKNKKKIFTRSSAFIEEDCVNLIMSLKVQKLSLPLSKKYNPIINKELKK